MVVLLELVEYIIGDGIHRGSECEVACTPKFFMGKWVLEANQNPVIQFVV